MATTISRYIRSLFRYIINPIFIIIKAPPQISDTITQISRRIGISLRKHLYLKLNIHCFYQRILTLSAPIIRKIAAIKMGIHAINAATNQLFIPCKAKYNADINLLALQQNNSYLNESTRKMSLQFRQKSQPRQLSRNKAFGSHSSTLQFYFSNFKLFPIYPQETKFDLSN